MTKVSADVLECRQDNMYRDIAGQKEVGRLWRSNSLKPYSICCLGKQESVEKVDFL